MFLARLVYREFDSKGEENQILSEEETPIKESWVREEFLPEFVTHIINMREFNHYNDEIPQDIRNMDWKTQNQTSSIPPAS